MDIVHKNKNYKYGDEKWEVYHEGVNAIVKIWIPKDIKIRTEHHVILAMSEGCEIELKANLGGLFTKQSVIQQRVKSTEKGDWVIVSPHSYGDVAIFDMTKLTDLFIVKSCFLASSENVNLSIEADLNVGKMLFGAGLIVLKASNSGLVAVHSSGGIDVIEIKKGEKVRINDRNLVAWSGTLDYKIVRATKSLISSFVSGEGFYALFQGEGKVFVSTRPSIERMIETAVNSSEKKQTKGGISIDFGN